MSDLYEFAKQVDVLVLFFFLYAAFCSFLGAGIAKFLTWFQKKWDALSKMFLGYNPSSKS